MSKCTIINAHITDQVLRLSNLPRIASGQVEALQIRCDFCGKWEGCGKIAVFYREGGEVYHVAVVNGLVTVPWEVLTEEGYFYFGIMGQSDLTRTTEVIRIEVAKGALTVATATPEDPTPDIYQQLLSAYGEVMQTREELVTGGYIETLKEQNTGGKFSIWVGTKAEYDAIAIKEVDRLYIINDDPSTGDVDYDQMEAELRGYVETQDAFVLDTLREEMKSYDTKLQGGIDANAAAVGAVRGDLPVHACGGTADKGGKYTYTHRVYICGKTGNDETGDGTSEKPYKTLDKWFSLCNNGRPDNRCYIMSAGTYDCSYYFFNHLALHITGGTASQDVDGVIINFTNKETITFYGGHYNFENVTLRHRPTGEGAKSCFNFETCSIILSKNIHFDAGLFKNYGCFISGTRIKSGQFEFYGTNGYIANIEATDNNTVPIWLSRGCNMKIGYTEYDTSKKEHVNKGKVTISYATNNSDSACYIKVDNSVLYLAVDVWSGEARAIGIDSLFSVVFLDRRSYRYLEGLTIPKPYSATGCVYVNNSSASSPKNLFTNGEY